MATAQVLNIQGQAWARSEDGSMRELKAGDQVLPGEVVVTAEGATVTLVFEDGAQQVIPPAFEALVSEDSFTSEPAFDPDNILDADSPDAVLAMLEGEGDLLETLEATAAGSDGGGGGEGSSFVRLMRIADENSSANSYEYANVSSEPVLLNEANGGGAIDDAEITVAASIEAGSNLLTLSGTTSNLPAGATISLTITDQFGNSITVNATIDGSGNYLVSGIDVSGLSDGALQIVASSFDFAGNSVQASTSALLDAVDSSIAVSAAIDGDGASLTITGTTADVATGSTVTLTITDQNGNSITAQATVNADGTFSVSGVDVSGLTDGPLTIEAVATDNNGSEITADTSVVLDAVESGLSVGVIVDNDAATVDISGSSTDVPAGSTVVITITDQNGNTITAEATVDADGNFSVEGVDISGLTDGPLTIDAVATDNNGNEISADTSAVLDAVESALTVAATVDNDAATLDINGTSVDVAAGSTVAIIITDQNGVTVTAEATVQADGTFSIEGLDISGLTDGELSIDVVATDNNGNEITADTSAVLDAVESALTVAATVDNDAATLDISGTSTDVAPGSTVAITITDQNGNTVTAQATVNTDGTFSIEGLDISGLTDGEFTIDVVAIDNNGNEIAADISAVLDAVESALTVAATVDNDAATLDISGTSTDVAAGSTVAIIITDQNGTTVTAQATVNADGTFSIEGVDVSGLTDGPLNIDAVATDNNGNEIEADTSAVLDAVESALSVSATVDNDAATLDISGTSVDVAAGETVAITITDQNGISVTAEATVNADGTFSVEGVDVSELTDGPLIIEAVATDNNGNDITADTSAGLDAVESALTVAATVDNDAATLDISGTSTDVAPGSTVAITITDQNGISVTAEATVNADGTFSVEGVDVSGLTDGPLTIDAVATDNNGNEINADTSAVLDAVESAITVAATVDNDAATLDISGTSTDVAAGSTVAITITDQNGVTVTAEATVNADGTFSVEGVDVSGLTDGPLTIDAVATDNNGNEITADTSAILDAVESALTVAASVDNDAATLDISGTSTDVAAGSTVAITITDQNGNTVTAQATVNTDGTFSIEGLDISGLTDGELTIDVVATDNNGNDITADTSAVLDAVESALTVAVTVDNDAATIDISGTSVDVAAGETVAITITDQNGTTVTAEATVNADGTFSVEGVDVSGLTDGPLTIEAVATDNNGNEIEADTSAVLDAVESALTVAATVDNDTATLDISGTSTDVAAGSTVAIIITDQNGVTVTAQATVQEDGTFSVEGVDVSGLTDGPLTIDAVATDNNGNELTAETSAVLDAVESALTVAATVDNDAATLDISGTSVDVAAGSTVAISITDQNGNTVTAEATVNADGTFSVVDVDASGLTDGPLTIDAVATDNNGNEITADTSAVLDAVESALTVAVTVDNDAATLDISGTSVDIAAGETVAITITDQNGATVTAEATVQEDGTFTIEGVDVSGLTDGPLTIDAVATDNNGNDITADTSAVLDAVESALTVAATVDNDAATLDISGTSTDVAAGSTVAITITDQNGAIITAEATVQEDGTFTIEGVDVSGLTDGPLTIDAVATDNNGNEIEADTSAVLDAVESALTVAASVDNDAATIDISGTSVDVAAGSTVAITITDQNGVTVTAQATVQEDGTFTIEGVDVSGLTDGPLTIDAVATDNNGNEITADTSAVLDAVESALTVAATVDNDAATMDISGTSVDVAAGETVAITITDQNGNTVTAEATVNADGTFSVEGVDVSGLTDGPLTIDAVATDNNGNDITADTSAVLDAVESALTVAVTVDNDAATLDISGTSTDVAAGSTVAITITDQNGVTVTAEATVNADGTFSVEGVDVSGLTDGPLTIDAIATDNNGNDITADTSAVLDAVESALTVAATVDNDAATLDINGTSTDVAPGSTVAITITDQNGISVTAEATVNADGTFSVEGVDVSGLTDGPLTIDAVATDNNGNEIEADTSAVLDAVESALTVAATVDNDAATLDISGTSADVAPGSTVAITITDQNGISVTAEATVNADGIFSVEGVDVSGLTDGPLTIEAVATDNNGNDITADTSAVLDAVESALTVAVTVDNDAATLDISGTSVDVAAGETVAITITDQNGATVTAEATVQEDGTFTIEGVDVSGLIDGPLTIDAVATDNNGNEVIADTSAVLDAVESALSVSATVDNDAATLDISGTSTDVAAGETVAITITDQNGVTVTAQATVQADGTFSIEGVDVSVLTDGPLTIDAVATDNNGNEIAADTSAVLDAVESALTVAASVDNDAATLDISGTSVDVAAGETVTITITDQNGVTVTAQATVQEDGTFTIEGVDVSGLIDGPLTIDAVATDNNGNEVIADTSAVLDAVESALSVSATVDDDAATLDVSGTSTDVAAGTTVEITITDQNGATVTAQATVQEDGTFSVEGVDVSGLTDGLLTIDAVATDNNGNEITADTSAVLDAVESALTVAATVDNDAATLDISGTSVDVAAGETVAITITDQNGNTVTAEATVNADGTFSVEGVDVSGLTDGPLTIDAVATDNNGNEIEADTSAVLDAVESALTVAATVDNDAATIDISGTSVDVAAGETVAITITDQNGNTVTAEATVNADGTFSVEGVDVSGLTDGPLTIDAVATDNNGNEINADTSAILDAVESALTVAASVDNDAATLDISGTSTDVAAGETVAITITDQNGVTVTAQATVQEDGTFTIEGVDVSGLIDGPLTIDAVATDNNGNEVIADTSAVLDAVESALTVAASVDNDAATLDISGTSADVAAGSTVAITITDQNGVTVTAEATVNADGTFSVEGVDVSGLTDGPLTIDVVATDNNGNEIAADTSAVLDAVESALTVAATVDNDAATLDISGTSTDVAPGSTVAITITDQNGISVTAEATVNADGTFSVEGVDVSGLTDGPLTIDVVAADNNGNEIAADTSAVLDAVESALTVAASVDNDAATLDISGTSVDVAAGETVTITITDQNGVTVTAQATVQEDGTFTIEGVDVSGLIDGPLTIDAVATDNNGNEVIADTSAVLDAVESALTVAASVDNDAATLDISGTSTDVAAGETVAITMTDQNGATVTAEATVQEDGTFSVEGVDVSGLTDGPLTIDVVATDNNGNEIAADTSAVLDAVESALTVAATVDDDAATLDVSGTSTDVAAGTTVEITITDQNGATVTAQATVQEDGTFSVEGVDVSGLTDGLLTIDAVATDNNGNDITADTSAVLDAVESALTVAATVDNDAATLDISGTSTDVAAGSTVAITITDQNGNTVTAQATVQEDGTFSVEGVDVRGLTDGPLTIDAVATDNNGNEVTADTSAVLDAVESTLTVAATVDNDAATLDISGTSVDVAAGESVTITITDQNGNTVTADATVQEDGTFTIEGVDVSGLTDGPLTIEAVATDNNGNEITADTSAVLDAVESALTVAATVDNDAATLDISGTSVDVAAGETVAITITDQNGVAVTTEATVNADGTFSVEGVDVRGLTDGPLTIDAAATDNNGNDITADTSAVLDAVESALTVAATVDNDAATLDISGTSTDVAAGSTVAITITDQNGVTVTAEATVNADGTFSVEGVDVSGLSDGPLTIDAVATDNNGNEITADTAVVLDAVDSGLTIELTVDSDTATASITGTSVDVAPGSLVKFVIQDQFGNLVTVNAVVAADGSFAVGNIDVSGLSDGTLTASGTTTDNNGNYLVASDTDELDALESALSLNASVNNEAATLDISGTSTDVAAGQKVAITITDQNGITVTAEATVGADDTFSVEAVDVSGLIDGPLSIDAVAIDNNGNEIEADTTVVLDAVASSITVEASLGSVELPIDEALAQDPSLTPSVFVTNEGIIFTSRGTMVGDDGQTYTIWRVINGTDSPITGELRANGGSFELSMTFEPGAATFIASPDAGTHIFTSDGVAMPKAAGTQVFSYSDTTSVGDPRSSSLDVNGTTQDVAEGATVTITITDQFGVKIVVTTTVDEDGAYAVDGIDVSSLSDGPLSVVASAVDNNGQVVESTTSVVLDAVEPSLDVSVTVDHLEATLDINGSTSDVPIGAKVSVTITDQNGNFVTTEATVNSDGAFSVQNVDVSSLSDGALNVTASAIDNNGDVVTDNESVNLDTTAPTLTVNAPDSNDTTPAISGTSDEVGATVSIVVTDANGQIQILTATVLADGTWGANVQQPLAEGIYQVEATVSDDVGNTAVADTSGDIDLTPPLLAFDDLPTNTNVTLLDLTGTSDEIGATVSVVVTDANGISQTVSGVVQSDGTWSVTLVRPLVVGEYTASATVSDAVGNFAMMDANAPGIIVPSVSISTFKLKEQAGIEVTSLIWEGGLSTSQFGVTSDLANSSSGTVGRLTTNDVSRTVNLRITSIGDSHATALLAVGDKYQVSWQRVDSRGRVVETVDTVMTVTRSDYFAVTGEARDILILRGLVNGNVVHVVIDSEGVATGSNTWSGWNGTQYIINDLFDTDVGFREFIVNGQGAANAAIEIYQVNESGNQSLLGNVTADANGNWSFDVGSLVGRKGQLNVVSTDGFGNISTDIKSFIFGETNIANTLQGSNESDLIVGGLQDDQLIGGGGSDVLIGGGGNDTFIWKENHQGSVNIPAFDKVQDFTLGKFNVNPEADRLDLSRLLEGENSNNIHQFIIAAEDGQGNTVLYISSNGSLAGDSSNANQLIKLSDVDMGGLSSADFIQKLLNDGQLLIDSGNQGTSAFDFNSTNANEDQLSK